MRTPCPARAQVLSAVPVDEPLFQPFPPEVVFAGYAPFETHEATLRLRNNDKARALAPRGAPRRGHACAAGRVLTAPRRPNSA